MSPKNIITIYLTVTSETDPVPLYNTDDELFLIRAPIYILELSSQPAADTLFSLSYNPRTDSISTPYPGSYFPSALTSTSKIHKNIYSMQEVV